MKNLLTFLLLLALTVPGISQDRRTVTVSSAVEDGSFILNGPVRYGADLRGTYPNGTVIPGTDGYFDYVTNGKNMNNIWVKGDTIVISYFSSDQADPTGLTTRISYYIVSTDKGQTWGTPLALTTLPRRSAYPDLVPYVSVTGRSIGLGGRLYTSPGPGSTGGGAFTDAFFGLGSFTSTQQPSGEGDYFTHYIGNDIMGGISGASDGGTSDTLNFFRYDMSTNTFSAGIPVILPNQGIGDNVRYHFAADESGNDMMTMFWNSTAAGQQMNYKRSTDGGTTWGSLGTMSGYGHLVNGDSTAPWLSMDLAYKPGTSDPYAAYASLGPGDPNLFLTATGSKILIWSPGLNGGSPVEVVGDGNLSSILNDDSISTLVDIQVGASLVSHPSIGFNNAGAMMCTFSAYQPNDTMDLFNFNDIYYTLSYDNGATWSTPVNLTNTDDWDEMYPSVAPSGNTNEFFIRYQATRGPGSQSFTDTRPTYVVHQVFDVVTTSGIQNISSEIPNGFSLKQNFPNPFNPSTSIQFNIPKASLVSLKVYDITGKEVATLVSNENLAAGTFQYDFAAKSLASGMYFYTLTAGDYKETKKMMLVK